MLQEGKLGPERMVMKGHSGAAVRQVLLFRPSLQTLGDVGDHRAGAWELACPRAAVACLENPFDRGAWWATVHGVAESWTSGGQSIGVSASASVLPMNIQD